MQNSIKTSIGCFAARPLVIACLLLGSLTSMAQTQHSGLTDSTNNNPFYRETFDDWIIDCSPIREARSATNQPQNAECTMSQRIEFEDNSQTLLNIDLYLNPQDGTPIAIFILPLGIPLNTAPSLSFNHSRGLSLKVSHCHADGCYFKAPLTSRLLETFLSMQSGQIDLTGNDNEAIRIPISGKGSRSAYNYFNARRN